MSQEINKTITILGIETSCDETSAAIYREGKILANRTSTQLVHSKYGGVVPELASRAHQRLIVPVVQDAFAQAGLPSDSFDVIAYTRGPGLMGSLLVGSSFAKGLALGTGKPLVEVNHMEAHILAHLIDDPRMPAKPDFPFLCLTVSGGHTQLVKVSGPLQFEVLGETIDDAAGEAFDKAAKLLGLPYPGGPVLDKLASQGNPLRFQFSKPRIAGFDFSFSGLKTSILYFIQDQVRKNENFIQENLNDLCASVQHTIVQILIEKLKSAVRHTRIKDVALSGGVAANSGLRRAAATLAEAEKFTLYTLPLEYCTDNAAMIAAAGYFKYISGETGKMNSAPKARLFVGDHEE